MKKDTQEALDDLASMWEGIDKLSPNLDNSPIYPTRPPNVFTVEEYCRRTGRSIGGAQFRLGELVRVGKLERVRFRTLNAVGSRVIAKVGWRLKDGPTESGVQKELDKKVQVRRDKGVAQRNNGVSGGAKSGASVQHRGPVLPRDQQ